MRIAIGQLVQETNTFSPLPTTLETFRDVFLYHGDELLTAFGAARVEIPAFLDVLRAANATPVPLLAGSALANGPLTRETFEQLMGEMEQRLVAAGPLDGVLLALHGAMCIEDETDAESEIIARVAAKVPPGTPIGVSLDLHGHVTRRMLQPNVFLIGYREYPHIDMYETGQRVAETLLETLRGKCRPTMAVAKRAMLVSPSKARTVEEPLQSLAAEARRLEAAGEILHASFFPVQPWLDVPGLGFGVLVCTDGDAARAQEVADRLADLAWARRHEFDPDLVELDAAIRIGLREPGTTAVADSGDAPSGGSAADGTGVLTALLAAGAERADRLAYLTLCDAGAAQRCAAAGVGSSLRLSLGHSVSKAGPPVTVDARVLSLHEGGFVMLDAGAQGTRAEFGLTAVVAVGSLRIAVRSRPSYEWDTGIYTAFGLRLEEAGLVFVRSPSHFKVAFAPRAARVLLADTPGPTCPNMRRLKFSRVTRPLFPLDENAPPRFA
jgi:microcystin degradation protein MlrC